MSVRAATLQEASSTSSTSFVLRGFTLLLFISGLQAYALGPIPFDWLAQFGFIALAASLVMIRGAWIPRGAQPMLWLFLWLAVVTLWNSGVNNFAASMPAGATSPYNVFIGLRLLSYASFISIVIVVYWLLKRGQLDGVCRWTVGIGAFFAFAALYIYLAHTLGLPEPPRTRMGTGGDEQSIVFTYAFHRALGTFREPSHLAEFLIVPLFLSIAGRKGRWSIWRSGLIASALLLTGSLTGIMGAAIGFAGGLLVCGVFRQRSLVGVMRIGLILILGLGAFSLLAIEQDGRADLIAVVWDRLVPLMTEGGLSASNRNVIYEQVHAMQVPVFGYGLGNSNILLSESLGVEVMASYQSLYYNVLYSAGFIGLILLIYAFSEPLLRAWAKAPRVTDPRLLYAACGYIAWLVMFGVHAEQLNPMFAVAFVLLIFLSRRAPKRTVPES
jgi:hypothetical protein